MSREIRQTMTDASAGCFTCHASTDARNAQAWATNHVRHHPGHEVEVRLTYRCAEVGT
jgi:hypothetical protein